LNRNHLKLPKTSLIPKISDVIAIDGHHGPLQAVSLKNQPEICVKKRDRQKPAISTGFIRFKMLLFRKQAF